MNLTIFICSIMPLIIFILLDKRNKNFIIWQRIKNRKKGRNSVIMIELIKKFIDKDCIISTVNSTHTGTIKEVTDTGVLIETQYSKEIVNAEFIISVKEYPLNKKGKKKMFV